MNENTVFITERNGKYEIQNNGIPEFALIGILECIVFEMKSAARKQSGTEPAPDAQEKELIVKKQENNPEQKQTESESKTVVPQPDLRTRISNAIKAINALGGDIEDTDLSKLTDEELQSELTELTDQYKRLKTSKGTKK